MNDSGLISTKTNPISHLVAVAGNPNAGKSTLINAIAGSRLHVGNWPGVTVEKKEARLILNDHTIRLVDLPGTYSLSAYSEEEAVARDFLLNDHPAVIINVIDATNLERNLYLTVQLLELEIPIVIALNMYDEVNYKGYKIDTKAIEKILGVKVVPTTAIKKKGVDDLLKVVEEILMQPDHYKPNRLKYSSDIEEAIPKILDEVNEHVPELLERYPGRWLAYKIIEQDRSIVQHESLDPGHVLNNEAVEHLKSAHDKNMTALLSDLRYAQTAGLAKEVLVRPAMQRIEITEQIDRIVLNRYLSLPIFFLIIWFTFKLTFDLSTPFVDWIDFLATGPISSWSRSILHLLGSSPWLVSLVTEGIIGGVGFVLVFVPVISAMMFFITFLEGCGYMARAAFVMDRYMHLIGLHGKSFIPMILGFGCNVPAIYATRTLENRQDKALTALLLPLMSCSARLPVYILFVSAFFPEHSGTVLFSIYLMGILLAVLVGYGFRHTLFRGETPVFIMELPPYRMPSLKNLLIHTWEKVKHFIIKAGTFILAMSIFIWFALNLPWGVENKKDSYLGQVAQVIVPVFKPIGLGNWETTASLLTGVIAKEMVVSTMGEIYTSSPVVDESGTNRESFSRELANIVLSFGTACKQAVLNVFATAGISSISTEEGDDSQRLRSKIQSSFTPLSAYAMMVFVLLYMPCLVTGVAIRNEFGSWKLFYISMAYGIALAWLMALIIYQGGMLLGLGG
jgi:ferrous iron transport protein B